jgi:type I restriction enzyme S subunit
MLWTESNMDAIKARAGGSTFAEISKQHFRPIPALRPPPAILSAFDSVVRPQYESTVNNLRENKILAEMRDAMMPELLSGNARVCP